MKTSKSIVGTIISGITLFLAAAPASGDPVFPPSHLSPDAVFATGTVSDQAVKGAWYFEDEADRRVSLKDTEKQESSPYASSYYFAKARVFPPRHSNNTSVSRDENRSLAPSNVANVADQESIADDNS